MWIDYHLSLYYLRYSNFTLGIKVEDIRKEGQRLVRLREMG